MMIVDIAMPLLNGLDASQRVKEMFPAVKVIFLTVNNDPEIAAEAFRRGASGYRFRRVPKSNFHRPKGSASVCKTGEGCDAQGVSRLSARNAHNQMRIRSMPTCSHS
jgi:DNA-binding NarL/FixJ family response regulator